MKRVRFPVRIKRGSSVVTIYRTPKQGYASFTVVHYDDAGRRCRKTFSDCKGALKSAEELAEKPVAGKPDMRILTGRELLAYARASNAVQGDRNSQDSRQRVLSVVCYRT